MKFVVLVVLALLSLACREENAKPAVSECTDAVCLANDATAVDASGDATPAEVSSDATEISADVTASEVK